MVKTFKILLLLNLVNWLVLLKHGTQHWALENYQVCSNDDPMLTFDLFTQMSTLVPYAVVWEMLHWWITGTQKLLKSII